MWYFFCFLLFLCKFPGMVSGTVNKDLRELKNKTQYYNLLLLGSLEEFQSHGMDSKLPRILQYQSRLLSVLYL